jgi:hypothetical protein
LDVQGILVFFLDARMTGVYQKKEGMPGPRIIGLLAVPCGFFMDSGTRGQ